MNQIKALGGVGLPALCSHIKGLKNVVGIMAEAFQETMVEIEEAINDFPVASSISISTEGWTAITPANSKGDYKYYYDITNSAIDSNDLPIVSVAPQSMTISAECGLCSTCESLNGAIRLYATSIPSENMNVSCWIIKGQSAAEKSAGESEREGVDWTVPSGNS